MAGILAGLFERRDTAIDLASVTGWPILTTAAGVSVTPQSALRLSAVYACVRILSESVAQLPLFVYEKQNSGGKARATKHPLYRLLHDAPNDDMTSFEYREMLMVHLCLRGNAYSEIVWNTRGQVQALYPLHPDRVQVFWKDNERFYRIWNANQSSVELPEYKIWHLRGMSEDGITGLSPIALHRQAIGLGLAAEEFGARFFGSGAQLSGVLQHPGELGDEAYERVLRNWNARYGGLSNAHQTVILEEGTTYQPISVAPEDAQFLETRQFQVTDIARIFRVPPHMIADLDKATFSNIEHQGIEFVVHTLTPWLRRFEQSLTQRMMTQAEQSRYFIEFLIDGLLRGDTESRYAAYATARQNGWLSANDIRELENMNPVNGGDVYLVPLNMVPADSLTGATRSNAMTPREQRDKAAGISAEKRASAADRRRIQQAHVSIYEDVFARILRRERNDIKAQWQKLGAGAAFDEWLVLFFESHQEFVKRNLAPVGTTMTPLIAAAAAKEAGDDPESLDNWLDAYLDSAAARHVGRSKKRLSRVEADDMETALDDWPDYASFLARDESVRLANAVTVVTFSLLGITRKVWVSFNPSCPYCEGLNGRTVGIDQWFLASGIDYQPDGATVVLKPSRNVGHAPAHGGCDCMVGAG